MERIIPRLNDMHIHVREGEEVSVAALHDRYADHVMVMPNTKPPITTAKQITAYYREIQQHTKVTDVWMTVYLHDKLDPDELIACCRAGAIAGKLYPDGVTTGSESGITSPRQLYPLFEVMQSEKMVLSIHGEVPGAFCLDRERFFLHHVKHIRADFPNLRIVLEHISTSAAVDYVSDENSGDLAATITPHHMALTLDDVVGDKLQPRNFCKPIAKTEKDRQALVMAVRSGNPHFFLGSDSAPHTVGRKYGDCGCAGVFTAPILPELLATIFEDNGMLDRLMGFSSKHAADFYHLERSDRFLTLRRLPQTVMPPDSVIAGAGEIVWPVFQHPLRWEVTDYKKPAREA